MRLRLAYYLVLLICIMPMIPGMIGILSSSLGFIPAVGLQDFNLQAFLQLWQWTGIERSLLLSVSSSLISSYLALIICFAILACLWHSKHWQRIEQVLAVLLALPHVAFAIGFAFLFSSTGITSRLFYAATGGQLSTHSATWLVQDPYALGLTIALALKEVPFLLLMSIPIIQQLQIRPLLKVGASLGYSTQQTWYQLIFPQWLPRMRLALFAVISYGISVVDLSLILGPNTPPTFAVLVWQWFNDPDLQRLPRAAAGALLLLGLASLMLLLIILIERGVINYYRQWMWSGRRRLWIPGKVLFAFISGISLIIFPIMLLWSVAQRWRFPDLWPSTVSLRFWINEWPNMLPALYQSLVLAIISGSLALVFAMISHEYRLKSTKPISSYWLLMPMLLPAISILFGMQIMTLLLSGSYYTLWVVWGHVFFAFPLVFLALDGAWKSYPPAYQHIATSLGKNAWHIFWRIKAPLLAPALFYAWAVGISVSLAQYLPTLMLGGGRFMTITTEAVTVSSGFDRRIIAIYALWQAILPFIFFLLAIILSRVSSVSPANQKTTQHEFSS